MEKKNEELSWSGSMRKRRTRFAVIGPHWFRSLGFTFLTVQRSKCEFILKECIQGGVLDFAHPGRTSVALFMWCTVLGLFVICSCGK